MLAMVHRAFRSRRCRRSDIALWAVGLFGEPEDEVGAPVADVAADLEAAGSGAEVAPVAQGALGDPEVGAGFLEGEHVVAVVLDGPVLSGVDRGCGHGGAPQWIRPGWVAGRCSRPHP